VLEVETGQVVVRASIAGATVFVDGRQVGSTPMTEALLLPPGKHMLSVRAAEYEETERVLEVQAGVRQVLDIVLRAKSAEAAGAAAGMAPASAASEVLLSTTESGTPKPKSRVLRVVTWTSLAGAVAAGAVAGTFWIIGNGQKNDFDNYNSLFADPTMSATDHLTYDSKRRVARADANRSQWIAIGCGIGAGALAVTALVTYLLDSGGEKSKTTVSLSPFGFGVKF
jgi:hypothetical protein